MHDIEECLCSIKAMVEGMACSQHLPARKRQRLEWVARQLNNLQRYLEQLMAELAAGLAITDIGFDDLEDAQDLLVAIRREASMLSGMLLSLQSLGR